MSSIFINFLREKHKINIGRFIVPVFFRGFDLNNIRIGVGSMTYAIKLRKLLLRSGINSSQVKWIENGGCIHGVEFDERNLYAAIAILRENDMDYTVNGTEK